MVKLPMPNKKKYNNDESQYEFVDPNKDCIVIGAHTGYNIHEITDRGKQCYAFEPCKKSFECLAMRKIPNLMPFNVGISNKEGSIRLYHDGDDRYCSVYQKEGFDNYEDVTVVRLDVFNLTNIGFMKIVVEGHEKEVLEGSMNTILNNIPVIYLEIDDNEYNSTRLEMIEEILNKIEKYYNFIFREEGHVLMVPK